MPSIVMLLVGQCQTFTLQKKEGEIRYSHGQAALDVLRFLFRNYTFTHMGAKHFANLF
jgi:hypothetical protein